MTAEQQKEFDSMCGAANVFNNSSVLLEDLIFKNLAPVVLKQHDKDLRGSIISSVVLYALSCEISIKALLLKTDTPFPRSHDLKSLFDNLPVANQDSIKGGMVDFAEDFNILLERNKKAFIEWRYFYEGNHKEVDITFLRKLSLKLGEECRK
jgi:HEPN domain-containing protein